ncbi:MAG: hypothetical protein KJZ84_22545 [Bryobacteraceae bacterium]|nr:hypothetical protein [Bryobacteraceae bacterium]
MLSPVANIPTAIMSLPSTLEFLCSCALTRAIAESVRIEWKSYDESRVLNTIYTLLPWKEKPGYAQLHMSRRKDVEDRYAELARRLAQGWLETLPRGPVPMTDYMNKLRAIRERDRENIQTAASDIRKINQEVVDDINFTIRVLEGIKLASTISVSLLGAGAALAGGVTLGGFALGASAGKFGAVNATYNITCSLIKTWEQVPSAKILAVGKETFKAAGSEAGGAYGKHLITQAAGNAALQQELVQEASRRIDTYSRIAENTISQRLAGHARAKRYGWQAKQQAAQQGLQTAQTEGARRAAAGSFLRSATAIVFAGWDIYDGITDFNAAWADTR